MKKIVCGIENVESFRAEIKAATPFFYALASGLYKKGMIYGLRGAILEIGPFPSEYEGVKTVDKQIVQECRYCRQWQRDQIGDGTGIGLCLLNEQPTKVKWPGTEACCRFEAMV